MFREGCVIPSLFPFPRETFDAESCREYEAALYEIYKQDFLDSKPKFDGKDVKVRFQPFIDGREESFVHFTCKNYENVDEREPDFERCKRIRWIRAIIENYQCKSLCRLECSGIKVWEEPYKNTTRVHFLFEDQRFLVVLEKREKYNLLITAFYLEYDNALRKQLKHYETYKSRGRFA